MKPASVWTLFIVTSFMEAGCQQDNCNNLPTLGCPGIVRALRSTRKSDFCKDVQCEGLERTQCPGGSMFEPCLTMCGCCSGCAKYKDLGDECKGSSSPPSIDVNCTDTTGICPILKNECKPGLICKYLGATSRVCALPQTPSSSNANDCEYKRNLGLTRQLHWTPTCDIDGNYAPKQCKGGLQDGTCFCVSPEGRRIFGREWQNKAENQTCACSRQVYDLRRNHGNIATIHCTSDGNFEPLQCDMDSGLCYCVDPLTGKLDGAILPEHQWKLLPCYSLNVTNHDPTGQYLRQCESEWAAGQRIRKETLLHGLDVYAVVDFKCDYDGSFAPIRRHQSLSYCVPKTGKMDESRGHFQFLNLTDMNCQCFRDSIFHEEENRPFTRVCQPGTGDYELFSRTESISVEYQCVDRDGFFYGREASEFYKCCLSDNCLDNSICYDAATNTRIYNKCDINVN